MSDPVPEQLSHEEALTSLGDELLGSLDEVSGNWLRESLDRVTSEGERALGLLFPRLSRQCGVEALVKVDHPGRWVHTLRFTIDLAAYRRCDAAAVLLFERTRKHGTGASVLNDLFAHGDLDERVAVMRCLPFVEDLRITRTLLAEAQRSNTLDVIEAAYCDHDVCARALDEDAFNRMVLKLAFADIPFWRVLGGLARANERLKRMLLDFAAERQAAGRPVWESTAELVERAAPGGTPC